MTLVANSVAFQDQIPTMNDIIDRIKEVSGLELMVSDNEEHSLHTVFSHSIAFSCDPDNTLAVYAYRPGAVLNAMIEDMEEDQMQYLPMMTQGVEGVKEKEGHHSIYLQTYLGAELSLYYATLLALISLGGEIQRPFELSNIKLRFPLSKDALFKRLRRHKVRRTLRFFLHVLLLPLTLILLVFRIVKDLLMLPFTVAKFKKNIKALDDQRK